MHNPYEICLSKWSVCHFLGLLVVHMDYNQCLVTQMDLLFEWICSVLSTEVCLERQVFPTDNLFHPVACHLYVLGRILSFRNEFYFILLLFFFCILFMQYYFWQKRQQQKSWKGTKKRILVGIDDAKPFQISLYSTWIFIPVESTHFPSPKISFVFGHKLATCLVGTL